MQRRAFIFHFKEVHNDDRLLDFDVGALCTKAVDFVFVVGDRHDRLDIQVAEFELWGSWLGRVDCGATIWEFFEGLIRLLGQGLACVVTFLAPESVFPF